MNVAKRKSYTLGSVAVIPRGEGTYCYKRNLYALSYVRLRKEKWLPPPSRKKVVGLNLSNTGGGGGYDFLQGGRIDRIKNRLSRRRRTKVIEASEHSMWKEKNKKNKEWYY